MLLCCVKKCFTNEQASFTMQKLKMSFFHLLESLFTCFLKDKTLHNHWDYAGFTVPYYNIPSNNRELQPTISSRRPQSHYNIPSNNRELQQGSETLWITGYYNIPSNNRELQPSPPLPVHGVYYNIPSNNRELQLILCSPEWPTYYNIPSNNRELQPSCCPAAFLLIITYQVITGNYSELHMLLQFGDIITYQVITGNYSWFRTV